MTEAEWLAALTIEHVSVWVRDGKIQVMYATRWGTLRGEGDMLRQAIQAPFAEAQREAAREAREHADANMRAAMRNRAVAMLAAWQAAGLGDAV